MLFITSFVYAQDFKRFFFFSEAVWLSLFVSILGFNLLLGNPTLVVNSFFILVFTACEAVILAAILLILSETGSTDNYINLSDV